jgi:hypothetical protein
VLEDLAELALSVGATEVIPVLRGHIEQERVERHTDNGYHTVVTLISALGAFGPSPQVHETLHRLFWDERFHPGLTGDIFLALCAVEPASFPTYLPHVLTCDPELIKGNVAPFIDTIGWETLCRHLPDLPDDSVTELLRLIGLANFVSHLPQIAQSTASRLFVHPAMLLRLSELSPAMATKVLSEVITLPRIIDLLPTLDRKVLNQIFSVLLEGSAPMAQIIESTEISFTVLYGNGMSRRYSSANSSEEEIFMSLIHCTLPRRRLLKDIYDAADLLVLN